MRLKEWERVRTQKFMYAFLKWRVKKHKILHCKYTKKLRTHESNTMCLSCYRQENGCLCVLNLLQIHIKKLKILFLLN